ncbi:MAG: hypothetical protein RL234_341, partial [Pseudomonadota bacterium]
IGPFVVLSVVAQIMGGPYFLYNQSISPLINGEEHD